MTLDVLERWTGGIGVIAGLVTLVIALWRGVWRGLQHPPGRTTGMADKVLRTPLQLLFGVLWIGMCFLLWRPVPFVLSMSVRVITLALGALLYFAGLALYLWGTRTLGEMYKPASGFGV